MYREDWLLTILERLLGQRCVPGKSAAKYDRRQRDA
jgi:hypothetical protein